MAMMASASSGNPYENYDNTEIEQDLLDPDDGEYLPALDAQFSKDDSFSKHR